MAVTIASYSTKLESSLSTITIDKPSGTVSGDLLFAFVGIRRNTTWTVPAGWTELQDQKCTTVGTASVVAWKTAGGSEGSNYTFTPAASDPMGGFILRITGDVANPASINSGLVEDNTANSSAEGTTITPLPNSLLIMCIIATRSGVSAAPTFSGYSIPTDNPTWTELAELALGTNPGSAMVIAYANRPEATATGTPSATVDSNSEKVFQFAAVRSGDNNFSANVLSVVSSVIDPSVTGAANVTIASTVSVTASVQAPTVSIPTPDWTNEDKNSTTWTNENKS